jgi:hypothetical protein
LQQAAILQSGVKSFPAQEETQMRLMTNKLKRHRERYLCSSVA